MMSFARKNMELVNEINDKYASLNILTEPTKLDQPFIPPNACHIFFGRTKPKEIPADIDDIELKTGTKSY
jgi:hypothetical protein